MPFYTTESLETLRQRIDLVEVLEAHIELKRTGSAYKALCPFHDEKTPSFTVQKGDTHYHCFGCGAHGDAIQFLIEHQKLSFVEAVEALANRFHVPLEKMDKELEPKGPNKALLKEALEAACHFFHLMLLKTEEGHKALEYLYQRGIDLDFVQHFRVGYAPKQEGLLRKALKAKGITDESMVAAGLLRQAPMGRFRDFFQERITFPIHQAAGAVIGFSARKFHEETFGGKYVNTPETPLFKKSRVLFGLNYCRRRIAKEKRAIVVEGQVDALKLIQAGLNVTVAGQGTAFGVGHVQELTNLGVQEVFLALDADESGQVAAAKIGNLFQKKGVDVKIVQIPPGQDPDQYLQEKGASAFVALLQSSIPYLNFLVEHRSRFINTNSPAGKNALIQELAKQIRDWEHPLMVHESLRTLAHLMQVPEEMVKAEQTHNPNLFIPRSSMAGKEAVNSDQILEGDFLRWILLMQKSQPHFLPLAQENITITDLHTPICRKVYETLMKEDGPTDMLSLAVKINDPAAQEFLSQLLHKKVDRDNAEKHFIDTMQKILSRNWMEKREVIRQKLQGGQCSDDEAMTLAKQFDTLKKTPPEVKPLIETYAEES